MKDFQYYLEIAEKSISGTFKQEKIIIKNVDTAYKFSFNLKYNNKQYKFEINMLHDLWPDNEQVIGAIYQLDISQEGKNKIDEYIEKNNWEKVFKPIGKIFYPKHLQKTK
jgi:hypothetical protein